MSGDERSESGRDRIDDAHVVALLGLPGMGPVRARSLLVDRSPVEAWTGILRGEVPRETAGLLGARRSEVLGGWRSAAATTDPDRLLERIEDMGMRVSRHGQAGYPTQLLEDPDPPVAFFAVGADLLVGGLPRVAVVGTRRCSGYGSDVAIQLGRDLAAAGVVVVSGLALGIDAAAHGGALTVPGGAPPLGVVGTGLDVVYPAANRALWHRVVSAGQLVSEMPPGAGPTRWCFPARNRIIAALAHVLVVVESHAGGGSMHTVAAALERDRPVLAVPGPIRSPASEGSNRLLADGAAPACGVDDVICALGLLGLSPGSATPQPVSPSIDPPDPGAGSVDDAVLEAMGWSPTSPDALAERTRLGPVELGAAIARLRRAGLVVETRGFLERRRRSID